MSSRGKPITFAIQQQRRKEAEARKVEYDKLSLQQKLDRLPKEGCTRQRTRLLAQLNKTVVEVKVEETSDTTEVVEAVSEPMVKKPKGKKK